MQKTRALFLTPLAKKAEAWRSFFRTRLAVAPSPTEGAFRRTQPDTLHEPSSSSNAPAAKQPEIHCVGTPLDVLRKRHQHQPMRGILNDWSLVHAHRIHIHDVASTGNGDDSPSVSSGLFSPSSIQWKKIVESGLGSRAPVAMAASESTPSRGICSVSNERCSVFLSTWQTEFDWLG